MADRTRSRQNADAKDEPEMISSAEPCVSIDVGTLVLDHHREVYGYAYRLTGNATDAEDLAQQTFLIAQQKLHQLREPSKARGWLYAVLRSCYLKGLRKRQPTPAGNLELNVDQIPEDVVEDEPFDRQRLQMSLNDLPDEYKTVLVMYYFEECSYKEIAEQLELPIGTVMSRLSRAKGKLRHKLLDSERAVGTK
jgi:RNA polymerase sigma-70 factor (ECF subfamily)